MKKKKVLMVHNFYQVGGGEHTVFENELKMLRENGHEVITYTRSNDEIKASKLKYMLLPFTTVWSFKSYFEVRKIIKQQSIEVVHCHNTFPLISPSVYYAARSLKVPVIQTIHNFRLLCPNGSFYCNGKVCEECENNKSFKPALKNQCYRNSKLQTVVVVTMLKIHRLMGTYKRISYIFLTDFNKSKFLKLIDINNENVYIKPNFVNQMHVIKKDQNNQQKFIFAGRLDENKGIAFLLNVWPDLPSEYQLHIYGDGAYKPQVEEMVKKNSNIYYYGFKVQNEVFEDLSSSVGLLFPSNCYEGYPMIISECFSAGKPVISTNIGNQNNIIKLSKGGTTFSCNNKEQFIFAINDVIKNNDLYSKNAKQYYQNNLTKEINYRKLVDIYDKSKHID